MDSDPSDRREPRPRRRQRLRDQAVAPKVTDATVHAASKSSQSTTFVFPLLLCFRVINALCVRTFFQPDEYFQSLEPAWKIAFGSYGGAWITWEWQHQLRSSLHPGIFAALYVISKKVMDSLATLPQSKATILIILPKILQGVFAAIGDYFTWKLAGRIYGPNRSVSWTALFLTVLSPWQWFCSTRTLSNSLEVVLTTVALYFWPWGLPGTEMHHTVDTVESSANQDVPLPAKHIRQPHFDLWHLRLSLVLAGIACVLRPTNLLIWASLVAMIIMRIAVRISLNGVHNIDSAMLLLPREALLCGTAVLGISAISDRLYFGMWTFPPYQWLNFNITQSLAVFYGKNDWHYYISQGFPLLLTTYTPFLVQALISLVSRRPGREQPRGGRQDSNSSYPNCFHHPGEADLLLVVITTIATLSLISHKEVRFIYPLLPCLHVLMAPYVLDFFAVLSPESQKKMDGGQKCIIPERVSIKRWRAPLLVLLVITNAAIGLYTTEVHQRGVIDVLSFLRHEYEEMQAPKSGQVKGDNWSGYALDLDLRGKESGETFAAFLMPCHSTPWRSHLVYPRLLAWALTCEPPLHIPASSLERALYRDEADRFYDDPGLFLTTAMNTADRPWPRYLVGFEGIETVLLEYCGAQVPVCTLRERWRGFNSHWHDDSRRKGAVVVWDFADS